MRTRLLLLLVPIVLMSGSSAARVEASHLDDGYPYAKALDGHRGFGERPDPEALRRLFRRAKGDDTHFLGELYRLARDVEVLAAIARARYARMGYFTLLDDRPGTEPRDDVAVLHAAFRTTRGFAGREVLSESQTRAFAHMLLDARFRTRQPLLEGFHEDVRQLRGALSLFLAHALGRAELTEGDELVAIARRADLAAARLRAVRLDLEALYEPVASEPVLEQARLDELLGLLRRGGGSAAADLREVDEEVELDARRLSDSLFTSRFDDKHRKRLVEREQGTRVAIRALREMNLILPGQGDGEDDGSFSGMSAVDRYRRAADTGTEGLRHDPFYADLQYTMGVAVDFFAGRHESSRYFDRFLALRGIRHWEYGTFGYRELDALEEYALLVVADWRPPDDDGQ